MTVQGVGGPPRWAQYLLQCVLRPQDRDVISGDLFEEYCDVELAVCRRHARRRYVAQVLSVVASQARHRVASTPILVGAWVILFFGLLSIPQSPSPRLAHTIPADPQLFLAVTTTLVVAVFFGVFLVVGWLWFVRWIQKRRPLRRFQ